MGTTTFGTAACMRPRWWLIIDVWDIIVMVTTMSVYPDNGFKRQRWIKFSNAGLKTNTDITCGKQGETKTNLITK